MSSHPVFFPLEEHGDDMLAADGEAIFRNFEVRGVPRVTGGYLEDHPI